MNKRKLHTGLFMIYGALMLWLVFDRPGYNPGIPYWEQVTQQLNLIPFQTLWLFAGLLDSPHPEYVRAAIINLVGNIVMFIPLGFLLPRVFPKCASLLRVLMITAVIITVVEILQLFTLVGSCDIDDLILNILGSGLGFGIHYYTKKPAP